MNFSAEVLAAHYKEALEHIAQYKGEGRMNAPWQDIVASLGQITRTALATAPTVTQVARGIGPESIVQYGDDKMRFD